MGTLVHPCTNHGIVSNSKKLDQLLQSFSDLHLPYLTMMIQKTDIRKTDHSYKL